MLLVLLANPSCALLGASPLFGAPSRLHVRQRASVARACASDEGADSSRLYASLRQRQSQLTARRDVTTKERALVEELGKVWPSSEQAQALLWQHWYNEEGGEARATMQRAEAALQSPETAGEATEMLQVMADFPDWAEPVNRLATLRFMQGNFAESAELCLRVLRMKP
eukprot:5731908-Prymnesium_polylepis.1